MNEIVNIIDRRASVGKPVQSEREGENGVRRVGTRPSPFYIHSCSQRRLLSPFLCTRPRLFCPMNRDFRIRYRCDLQSKSQALASSNAKSRNPLPSLYFDTLLTLFLVFLCIRLPSNLVLVQDPFPFLSPVVGEPTPKTVGRNGFRSPTRHEHVGTDSVVKIIKAAVKIPWRNIFSADCYFIGDQFCLRL